MKREPKVKPVRAWALRCLDGGLVCEGTVLLYLSMRSASENAWPNETPIEVEIRPAPKPSAKGAGTARPKGSERKRRKARKAKR